MDVIIQDDAIWKNAIVLQMSLLHPLSCFAVSYVLLAAAVSQQNGSYTPLAVTFALLAFGAACIGAWHLTKPKRKGSTSHTVLGVALMVVLLIGLDVSPLLHDKNILVDKTVHALEWALLAFPLIGYVLGRCPPRARSILAGIFIATGISLRIAVPLLSPAPVIDAFTMSQESAAHLLDGQNPYTTPVSDPYGGERDDLRPPHTYAYPPATLLLQLPGFLLPGDVRYMSVLGDIAIVCAIWLLLRRKKALRELLILLFLWHPKGLFIIEQAWTDPLIALCLAAWLLLQRSGRGLAAAAIFGLLLGIKQYLILFGLHWLRLERSPRRLIMAACVITAIMLPFALWNPHAFWNNGILFQLQGTFRPDALTVLSALGTEGGRGWSLLVGLAATAGTMWLFRKMPSLQAMLAGLMMTMFAVFLFGSQAFCNYYYLVWVLMLLTMAVTAADEITDDGTAGAPL